jgi:hypothetical protein
MARIRSIKPEFWRDAKIASLPKSTALFFIAIWNFADDQGIVETDSRSLALQVPIYRSQDIQKMLNALWKEGLIVCSPCDGLALVNGWHHQKIDKPRDGKWIGKEINWLTWGDSTMIRDESRPIDARIGSDQGEDRKGKDRIKVPKRKATPSARRPKADVTVTNEVVAVYCTEFKKRYGSNPIIMQPHAKQLRQLLETVGSERAKELVRAYFQMNDKWYVTKRHDTWTLISNIQAVQQFNETGKTITGKEAQDIENQETLLNQLDRLGSDVA